MRAEDKGFLDAACPKLPTAQGPTLLLAPTVNAMSWAAQQHVDKKKKIKRDIRDIRGDRSTTEAGAIIEVGVVVVAGLVSVAAVALTVVLWLLAPSAKM